MTARSRAPVTPSSRSCDDRARRPPADPPALGSRRRSATVAWLVAWFVNLPAANWIAYDALGLERGSHLGDAVAFFLLDVPKVLLLLTGIVTLVSFLRSFVSPERVRRALAGRGVLPGTAAAAGFGVITPFCSCSAVPLFIGFVEAGVPLGVTFAFLVASPMVNEVALVLLWGLFGPAIALAYMAAGLTVAIVAGPRDRPARARAVRRGLRLEGPRGRRAGRDPPDAWATACARRGAPRSTSFDASCRTSWPGSRSGRSSTASCPRTWSSASAAATTRWPSPRSSLLGVPLYSNAAGTIPIVEALLGKGLPVGSALAFMMAVTALSVPELVILRRVMKPRLIALFVAIVASGILLVGYGFNLFLA